MIPLSVIIPFYNASQYLKKTVTSLLCQSLPDIEYIFVDDGSTDDSKDIILSVLLSFPHKRSQVKIYDSAYDGRNHGIACARQTGMDFAQGEYIIFCDADDWLDEKYYEQLYRIAVSKNASMVVGDHCLETRNGTVKIISPDIESWDEFRSFPDWIHLALWVRLIKLSLIKEHNLRFFDGINLSEDYGFLMRVYYHSTFICNIHSDALYHYNKLNDSSLTHTLNLSAQLQRIKCLNLIDSFFVSQKEDITSCKIHKLEKYNAKDTLLTINEFKQWRKTFPEVTKMVLHDSKRNFLYKMAYLSGQYINWRILWLYHSLHNIVSER